MDPCSSTTHCAVEFLGAYQPQSTAFMPVGSHQQQQMPLPPSLTRVEGDGFSDSDTDETRTPTQSDAPGQSQRRKLRRGVSEPSDHFVPGSCSGQSYPQLPLLIYAIILVVRAVGDEQKMGHYRLRGRAGARRPL
uniref:Uncharacterized protein n=1 Tax=Plectus sambesii TaxID=2011161 RepID=A0A914XRI8_9BILA